MANKGETYIPGEVGDKLNQPKENKTTYRDAEWYKKLSPEKQKQIDSIEKEKVELQKNIETLKAGIDFKSLQGEIINSGLERNGNPEDTEDSEEIRGFRERMELSRKEVVSLKRELRLLQEKQVLDKPISADMKTEGDRRNELFERANEGLKNNDKFNEIIGNKNLSEISAGEIYLLRKEGFDLSSLFLIPTKGESEISKDNMKILDEFIVNFGGNKEANNIIGAGDLLSIDIIKEVEINGKKGIRGYNPRPGYYTKSGDYLPIYNSDTIKVTEEKPVTAEEKTNFDNASNERFNSYRKSEILDYINSKALESGDIKELELPFKSEYDKNILSEQIDSILPESKKGAISYDKNTSKITVKKGETIRGVLSSISEYTGKGTRHLKYMDTLVKLEAEYGIPKGVIIKLIYHENRNWEPTIKNRDSSAYGLGQIINSTWNKYGKGLDRNNPNDQLEATAKYLKYIKGYRKCNNEMAIALYNTGENFKYNSDDKAPKNYVKWNTPIINKIPSNLKGDGISKKEYFIGAVAYYNDIDFKSAESKIV